MKLIITLLTLITSINSETTTTDLLWKPKNEGGLITYKRPYWAKNITIEIDDITKNIQSVEGIIIPLSTTTRYQTIDQYNGCYLEPGSTKYTTRFKEEYDGYNRGHIMGLRNGGPDISKNVVPQWGKWQADKGQPWYNFEEDINKKAFDLYGWDKTTQPVDLCMNETQNVCVKEPVEKVYWEINLKYGKNNPCEPESYEGIISFGEKKYTFNFPNNGTERIILEPYTEKIPNDESSLIPWVFVFIVLSIWICVYCIYKKITHTIIMNEIVICNQKNQPEINNECLFSSDEN